MSKLQILIPQYSEDENTIKPLLDSIAIQQNIDFKDIEVFIGNDGSDTKLSIDFLKQYKYRLQYHYFEHSGLAATRKKLFDISSADYIMFCDADDRFINTLALSIILNETKKEFDALICTFFEEIKFPNGETTYFPHKDDSIFVHGKVYRRQFLLDNEIEWHPELHEHQDSAYNVLARTCAKKIGQCDIPLYLWCSNPKSICRKNGIYHLPNTWPHMIDSYDAVIADLKERGYGLESCYYAKYCLYASYYEMSHRIWTQEDILERKTKACKRLADFYYKHKLLIKRCDEKMTEKMIKATKEHALLKGPFVEDMPPFEEWLDNILKLYKGA